MGNKAIWLLKMPIVLVVGAGIALFSITSHAGESVVMNLMAQNDSNDPQETPIIQYLPHELSKEDILDNAGLEIRYDEKRDAMFLFNKISLKPKEVKKFRVVVRDIWQIPKEDIDFIKKQTQSRVQYLEGTDDHAAGQALADKINKDLSQIETAQSEEMDIPQRIEMHRIATEKITEMKSQITVMSDFVKQARWLKEMEASDETVKMLIQIKNPLDEAMKSQKVTRYLPRGVSPADVLDAQGFEIKYDPERQLFYLYREIDLKASEAVTATVVFKNAWKIPIKKLDELVKSSQDFQARLKGTQYEDMSNKIYTELERLSTQIKELQAKEASPDESIVNFSLNLTRYNAVEDGKNKLKELVEELEHPVPQTLPYYIKPATPDVSTTWKIIYGFIGFLTVLGVMFYALWWGQSKARLNRKYETHKA